MRKTILVEPCMDPCLTDSKLLNTESVSKILHQHLLLTYRKKRVEKLPLEATNLVIQSVHAILWLLIFGWYNKMNPETVRHHGI
eukprot:g81246.t1